MFSSFSCFFLLKILSFLHVHCQVFLLFLKVMLVSSSILQKYLQLCAQYLQSSHGSFCPYFLTYLLILFVPAAMLDYVGFSCLEPDLCPCQSAEYQDAVIINQAT